MPVSDFNKAPSEQVWWGMGRMRERLQRPARQQTQISPAPFQLHRLCATEQGSPQKTLRAISDRNIRLEFAAVEENAFRDTNEGV